MSYLVNKRLFEQGELLFKNILTKKWLETQQDYINGMEIYINDADMFYSIYQDYKENTLIEKSQEHLEQIMSMILKNPLLHSKIFIDLMNTYVLNGGLQITDSFISKAIAIYEVLQEFGQLMQLVEFMDKYALGIKYSTRIKFYELFKKCSDEEVRSQLFSKLNQNVLKGKAEGNIRRKIAENFSNLKSTGSQYFEDVVQISKGMRKRQEKTNPKKFPFKKYYDDHPEMHFTLQK